MLEKAKEDAHQADELIGRVRLAIRQSGYSAAHEYSMKEPVSCDTHKVCSTGMVYC